MNEQKRSLVLGGGLIVIGLLSLFFNLDIIDIAPSMVVALAFLAGAVLLFLRFVRDNKMGFLVTAAIAFFVGSSIFIEETRIVHDEYIAVLLFWLGAALFGIGYLRDTHKWGLLIPAGLFATLGLMIVMDQNRYIDDDLLGGTLFLGSGLTFFLLYAIRNQQNKLEWAKIPAVLLIGFSAFIYFATTDSFLLNLMFPVILIALGGYLVYQATRNHRAPEELSGA